MHRAGVSADRGGSRCSTPTPLSCPPRERTPPRGRTSPAPSRRRPNAGRSEPIGEERGVRSPRGAADRGSARVAWPRPRVAASDMRGARPGWGGPLVAVWVSGRRLRAAAPRTAFRSAPRAPSDPRSRRTRARTSRPRPQAAPQRARQGFRRPPARCGSLVDSVMPVSWTSAARDIGRSYAPWCHSGRPARYAVAGMTTSRRPPRLRTSSANQVSGQSAMHETAISSGAS